MRVHLRDHLPGQIANRGESCSRPERQVEGTGEVLLGTWVSVVQACAGRAAFRD